MVVAVMVAVVVVGVVVVAAVALVVVVVAAVDTVRGVAARRRAGRDSRLPPGSERPALSATSPSGTRSPLLVPV